MKNFKTYEKEYEDVYSSERTLKEISLDKISNTIWLTNFQYIQKFKKFGREMYLWMFDSFVRFVWLNIKFNYNNYWVWIVENKSTNYLRRYFANFARNYIWMEFKAITAWFFPVKVISYFPDFFPMFDQHDPFEEPEYYKFPYENITPDFLLLVYQMPERLDLLNIAETQKMTFAKFYDYVINYVYCYNAEHKKDVFTFMHMSRHCPSFVVYNNKRWKRYRAKPVANNVGKKIWKN